MPGFDLGYMIAPDIVTPKRRVSYVAPGGPRIDNSGSAKVTYSTVTLRAQASVTLDDIVLIVREPPGSVITGTWEATATNAETRLKGSLAVKVAMTALPVSDLLGGIGHRNR
jgi:hypothetical protein